MKVIFCLLTSPKFDLDEVEEAIFQGVACYFELFFGLLTNLNCDFFEVVKRCTKDSLGTFNLLSASGPAQNATWVK